MSKLSRRLLMASAPTFRGVLDTLQQRPVGAWSLRRLTKTYSGPCCLVMRSTDGARMDIGFTANGDLDTAVLLDFIGSADGRIAAWYDQTGQGRYMYQSTPARQPLIVTAGSLNTISDHSARPGILAISTAAAWQNLSAPGITVSQPCTRVSVSGFPAASTIVFPFLNGTSNSTVSVLRAVSATYHEMYDYTVGLRSTNPIRVGDASVVNENYNTTSSSLIVNGKVTNGSLRPAFDGINQVTMGTISGYNGARIVFGEVLQFGSLLDGSDENLLFNDQQKYWETP
ncbi:arabinofuranosidase catalytic domain-containing protein [Paraburkholderia youngii]|uniref:arabinofuranosidase catalytic domain-containing protein n=1 Tax=Paraburkholderia youngii TaxID=2782701 RepID=UPI003D1F843A